MFEPILSPQPLPRKRGSGVVGGFAALRIRRPSCEGRGARQRGRGKQFNNHEFFILSIRAFVID